MGVSSLKYGGGPGVATATKLGEGGMGEVYRGCGWCLSGWGLAPFVVGVGWFVWMLSLWFVGLEERGWPRRRREEAASKGEWVGGLRVVPGWGSWVVGEGGFVVRVPCTGGRDHPLREPALRFLARVRTGEVEAYTSTEVLRFSVVFGGLFGVGRWRRRRVMWSSPVIGQRLGQYEITAKLGEGGMGEVYRATDTRLDRQVAIKVLPAEFTEDKERLARFEREAKLLAQLHHPNIASIFGLEESDGTRALVMELVPGPTLAERLESGAFAIAESLSVALQIAQALEEAHEKGIVHRDLKPQNIKASIEGKVKVLDFGLAKAMDPSAGSAASAADLARSPTLMQSPTLTAAHGTQLGVILGTAAYMAPEQARGLAVDKRADIWAFGVVLYEMLVGRSLFAGDTVTDTLAGVLKTEIDFSQACRRRRRRRSGSSCAAASSAIRRTACTTSPMRGSCSRSSCAARARSKPNRRGWSRFRRAARRAANEAALVVRRAPRRVRGGWPRSFCASRSPDRAAGDSDPGDPLRRRPRGEGEPAGLSRAVARRPHDDFLAPAGRRARHTLGALLRKRREPDARRDDRRPAAVLVSGRQEARFFRRRSVEAPRSRDRSLPDRGPGFGSARRQLERRRRDLLLVRRVVGALAGFGLFGTEPSGDRTRFESRRAKPSLPPWPCLAVRSSTPASVTTRVRESTGAARRARRHDASCRRSLRASYDRRGYLLWVHDGSLVAQRFDPANGTLSGEISPLAAQIGAEEQAAAEDWYSVSASGTIALRHGARESTELAWFDRRGAPLAAVTSAARLMEPALSPDGRQVAVQTVTAGEKGQLWIFDAAGLDQGRRLTFDAGGETPVWSPDGRAIAYTSPRTSGWAVFRKSSDGSGAEELLFESGVGCWVDSWFPDGKSLLIERYDPDRGADLWILPLDGSKKAVPFLEGRANEAHAAVSPDGKLVAYVSDDGGVGQVFVRAVASAGGNWQVSRDGGDWPHWRADGKESSTSPDTTGFSERCRSRAPIRSRSLHRSRSSGCAPPSRK